MVSNRRRSNAATTTDDAGSNSSLVYEQLREKRMKENKERMEKLGVLELSHKLTKTRNPKNAPPLSSDDGNKASLPPSAPARRSSRLKIMTPVNYAEIVPKEKKAKSKSVEIRLRQGSKPEIYTEEDEKLLGECETPWKLFVDGYGEDGNRIYDPEKGETCHQCRQKTLGLRSHCSKCNLVQGQFCGDCLYIRYGENVLEVNQNPTWICPVCRGICNCSICRKLKGWAPTGALYKKVRALGFKSVAHYLILTFNSHNQSKVLVAEGSEPTDNESVNADDKMDGDAESHEYHDAMEEPETEAQNSAGDEELNEKNEKGAGNE